MVTTKQPEERPGQSWTVLTAEDDNSLTLPIFLCSGEAIKTGFCKFKLWFVRVCSETTNHSCWQEKTYFL